MHHLAPPQFITLPRDSEGHFLIQSQSSFVGKNYECHEMNKTQKQRDFINHFAIRYFTTRKCWNIQLMMSSVYQMTFPLFTRSNDSTMTHFWADVLHFTVEWSWDCGTLIGNAITEDREVRRDLALFSVQPNNSHINRRKCPCSPSELQLFLFCFGVFFSIFCWVSLQEAEKLSSLFQYVNLFILVFLPYKGDFMVSQINLNMIIQ